MNPIIRGTNCCAYAIKTCRNLVSKPDECCHHHRGLETERDVVVVNLQRQNAQLLRDLEESQLKLRKSRLRNKKLEEKCNLYGSAVVRADEQVRSLESRIVSFESHINMIEEQLSIARQALNNNEENLLSAVSHLSDARNHLDESERENRETRNENEQLRKFLETKDTELEKKDEEIQNLRVLIESLSSNMQQQLKAISVSIGKQPIEKYDPEFPDFEHKYDDEGDDTNQTSSENDYTVTEVTSIPPTKKRKVSELLDSTVFEQIVEST